MYPLSFIRAIFSESGLSIAIIFSVFVLPAIGATFDAQSFFLYIDRSCSDLDLINNIGDEMNALAKAGQDAFNWTPLSERTFAAYFGKIGPDISLDDNSALAKRQFNKLGTSMKPGIYSLYCDGSAMAWVTTEQEGDNQGQPFKDGKGPRWYVAPDRHAPSPVAFYIEGQKRDDYCTPPDPSKKIGGASTPGKPYVILCPTAFALKPQTLLGLKDTQQKPGMPLDNMTSTGAVMLHEFTHAVLGTNRESPEIYGAFNCMKAAVNAPGTIRANADTFMLFAMAMYLEQNAWVLSFAEDKTKYDSPPTRRRMVRRNRPRYLDAPLYPRGQSYSSNPTASGTLGYASSTVASPSFVTGGSTAFNSIKSGSVSSSATGLPSSSPSVLVPGSGILPFPTTTSSSSSSSRASTTPLSFSGIWSDTSTATPVSFTWFDIPTSTISNTAATSEGVFLGGLFSALHANRQWLTDPKLKSQYIDDVKKAQAETLALFNDLNVKPPEVDCSNTKRKRKRNALSERQLRALLHDRSIISSITGAISDAVGDVAKLISCAVGVVGNLAKSIEAGVTDIDEIQNLTDTLAEIGKDLEDEDDTKSSSTERPSSSTSLSSSSCTGSTAVPICTQTVSLSTSFLSGGTSSFTVSTITKTKCITTTIAGCTGTGKTTTVTTSTANSGYILATEAIFLLTTAPPIPTESLALLRSLIVNEYTESISYNGTTAGEATRTALGSSVPSSTWSSLSSSATPTTSTPSPTTSAVTLPSAPAASVAPSPDPVYCLPK
jgi:hypothetical protein